MYIYWFIYVVILITFIHITIFQHAVIQEARLHLSNLLTMRYVLYISKFRVEQNSSKQMIHLIFLFALGFFYNATYTDAENIRSTFVLGVW